MPTVHLDAQDARTVRRDRSAIRAEGRNAEGRFEGGTRFASDLAGAAWPGFMLALAERSEQLRRTVACLFPAEMAALLPASREQAEDFREAGDARALGRVRAVLRLLGKAPLQAGAE